MVSLQSSMYGRRKRKKCTFSRVSLSCCSSGLGDGIKWVLRETALSFPSQATVNKSAES